MTDLRQIADLQAVHAFHLQVLESRLGHTIPLPAEVAAMNRGDSAPQTTVPLGHWLDLVDMAVTPSMVREELKAATQPPAESLLRYYVSKASPSESDLFKTDLVVTWLYRHAPGGPEAYGPDYAPLEERAFKFADEVRRILGVPRDLPLPTEYRQLAREFEAFEEEVRDFGHFDQLMDARILDRVRGLKLAFGVHFYHPEVLATAAPYNATFGACMDSLFREAAHEIKDFAAKVQQEGASVMSRVDDDVVVQQLAEVQEEKILEQEYERAQAQFRNVSKYRKAVEKRLRRKNAPPPPPPPSTPALAAAPQPAREAEVLPLAEVPSHAIALSVEEQVKLYTTRESIRLFLRSADQPSSAVVPLRFSSITLTNAEMEAFRTDFAEEKSFRADLASVLIHLATLQARFIEELHEFSAKREATYLWKPHADSLTALLSAATRLTEEADRLKTTAVERGLFERSSAILHSVRNLSLETRRAIQALSDLDIREPTH